MTRCFLLHNPSTTTTTCIHQSKPTMYQKLVQIRLWRLIVLKSRRQVDRIMVLLPTLYSITHHRQRKSVQNTSYALKCHSLHGISPVLSNSYLLSCLSNKAARRLWVFTKSRCQRTCKRSVTVTKFTWNAFEILGQSSMHVRNGKVYERWVDISLFFINQSREKGLTLPSFCKPYYQGRIRFNYRVQWELESILEMHIW